MNIIQQLSQPTNRSVNGAMYFQIQCLPMQSLTDCSIILMFWKWWVLHTGQKTITIYWIQESKINLVRKLHFHFGTFWHFYVDIYNLNVNLMPLGLGWGVFLWKNEKFWDIIIVLSISMKHCIAHIILDVEKLQICQCWK